MSNQLAMFDQTETFKKLPGVLSFQRGIAISDALFFNQLDDNTETPVMVVRHGIRGTQNVSSGDSKPAKAKKTDQEANAAEASPTVDGTTKDSVARDVSNVQITDTAKLDPRSTALKVRCHLRALDLEQLLFAVAASKGEQDTTAVKRYRESVERFIAAAKESEGLQEVSRRIARNIANGRWLWRNRTLAHSIRIEARGLGDRLLGQYDALAISLNHFDNVSESERVLASVIADGLRGEAETIAIEAIIDFGIRGSVEVFPSQNYVEKKPKGFARPLYCVGHPSESRAVTEGNLYFDATREMGQAALRDQKIGNALRTIDTWYPAYAERGRPIPVEPNGANLDAQAFFRDKKTSAFEYARRFNLLDPNTSEGQFMIASLIRGGVLSGGEE